MLLFWNEYALTSPMALKIGFEADEPVLRRCCCSERVRADQPYGVKDRGLKLMS